MAAVLLSIPHSVKTVYPHPTAFGLLRNWRRGLSGLTILNQMAKPKIGNDPAAAFDSLRTKRGTKDVPFLVVAIHKLVHKAAGEKCQRAPASAFQVPFRVGLDALGFQRTGPILAGGTTEAVDSLYESTLRSR